MSGLFAKALADNSLRNIYEEIHFAVPPGDGNDDIFLSAIRSNGVQVETSMK